MSDILDRTGLTLKTLPELKTELENGYKAAYGDDISLGSDTPDGQAIAIQAQVGADLREVLQDVYTSMDPDQAQGTVLDQRVTINGIQRKGGTFTVVPVNITVDRSVSLIGLDDASDEINLPEGVYTIKDDAGTQFALIDSVTIAAGTHSLAFRAVLLGAVEVMVGTITTAVTAIAGVTAIYNASGVTTQGVDEESDAALRVRRRRSIAGTSVGFTDSIEAAILALDGVTACICDENVTDITDAQGIPPHSIWVLVKGGDDQEIAEAIYATRSAGSGMRGDEVIAVTRPNGRTIYIRFDRTGTENLWVKFNIQLTTGGTIDTANLKTLIVDNVTYDIGEDASGDRITCFLKDLNQNYRITGMLLSTTGVGDWLEVVAPSSIANQFVLDVSRIAIS